MKPFLILTIILLIAAGVYFMKRQSDEEITNEKCCSKCTGKSKFYSIDTKHNRCGECCMDPKYYKIFKIFESGLTLADNDTPCATYSYSIYENTETHGFGPLKVTLDKYKKPE